MSRSAGDGIDDMPVNLAVCSDKIALISSGSDSRFVPDLQNTQVPIVFWSLHSDSPGPPIGLTTNYLNIPAQVQKSGSYAIFPQ